MLKRSNWVENGGQGKALIAEGMIRVNDEVELRKRRQMKIGDVVELQGGPSLILIQGESTS